LPPGMVKTGNTFNYYQLPYTYIPFSYDFASESYFKPFSRPYHGSKRWALSSKISISK